MSADKPAKRPTGLVGLIVIFPGRHHPHDSDSGPLGNAADAVGELSMLLSVCPIPKKTVLTSPDVNSVMASAVFEAVRMSVQPRRSSDFRSHQSGHSAVVRERSVLTIQQVLSMADKTSCGSDYSSARGA